MADGFLVPAPAAGDQTKFLSWDTATQKAVWRDANTTNSFLCIDGTFKTGNATESFLCGNGTWAKMTVTSGRIPWTLYNDGTLYLNKEARSNDSSNGGVYVIGAWDTSQSNRRTATAFGSPFSDWANRIKSVKVEGTITPVYINYLFYMCTNLANIDGLANFDTSNVVDAACLFYQCESLKDLSPVRQWETGIITTFESLLYGCTQLADLSPLSGWTTSSVLTLGSTFKNCSSIKDVSPIKSWDTKQVTNMYHTFNGCSGVTDFTPLNGWNVSKVTASSGCFGNTTGTRPSWGASW